MCVCVARSYFKGHYPRRLLRCGPCCSSSCRARGSGGGAPEYSVTSPRSEYCAARRLCCRRPGPNPGFFILGVPRKWRIFCRKVECICSCPPHQGDPAIRRSGNPPDERGIPRAPNLQYHLPTDAGAITSYPIHSYEAYELPRTAFECQAICYFLIGT
jgi:hypothetical protein